jgi:hypothetical protein
MVAAFLTAMLMLGIGQRPTVPPAPPYVPPSDKPAAVEKIGPETYRIGEIRVDTARKEIAVAGTINDVTGLEFVANTRGGYKAYESAITLDTNGISFNVAMLLIGVDVSRSRPSARQFDPTPPRGDPVEVTVEWKTASGVRRVPVEHLLYDQRTKQTFPEGPWVYTGSALVDTMEGKKYLADMDGVIIGFMHGPQAIIDNPSNHGIDDFGWVALNPELGLTPGTAVTLKVRALPLPARR